MGSALHPTVAPHLARAARARPVGSVRAVVATWRSGGHHFIARAGVDCVLAVASLVSRPQVVESALRVPGPRSPTVHGAGTLALRACVRRRLGSVLAPRTGAGTVCGCRALRGGRVVGCMRAALMCVTVSLALSIPPPCPYDTLCCPPCSPAYSIVTVSASRVWSCPARNSRVAA